MKHTIDEKCFSGTGLKNLNITDFHNFEIPIPSLELQNQIVEELDAIYYSKKNASDMIENLKKQMKSLINTTSKFERDKLSNVCDISKGKRCLDGKEIGYPYHDVSCISRLVEKYIIDEECVLTPRAMSIGRFVYINEKCHPSDDMFILKPKKEMLVKYLYYFSTGNLSEEIKKCIHGVKPTITYDAFDTLYINTPPLDIQTDIVKRLDALSEQITCLEKIESQADENAKFVLDGYLGI
jgi:restriction endonuclease S subunit